MLQHKCFFALAKVVALSDASRWEVCQWSGTDIISARLSANFSLTRLYSRCERKTRALQRQLWGPALRLRTGCVRNTLNFHILCWFCEFQLCFVFPQWQEVLSVLAQALDENGIKYKHITGSRLFQVGTKSCKVSADCRRSYFIMCSLFLTSFLQYLWSRGSLDRVFKDQS